MTDLTPKQQRFVEEYVIDLNGKQAAIRAGYGVASAEVTASRLLSNLKVSAAVAEQQQKISERLQITVDDLIAELDEAREKALLAETPQTSAAIAATMGKAKLLGLLVDKVDARVLTASLPVSVDDLV